MNSLLASFISALGICLLAIPSIIRVAEEKHLFDVPDNRKRHAKVTPTLGGIAIFAAFVISSAFWVRSNHMPELQYIICSLVLIFFTGIKDDILSIAPVKKLVAQICAASILVLSADIRLTSMYGIFGVYEIHDYISYILSILTIVGITNAFNLIDGINLLAASTGILCTTIFGCFFSYYGLVHWGVFCFSMSGALLGFCYYNRTPAKIFMGDTGALLLGIVCAILAIKFVELTRFSTIQSGPTLAIAIMITPIFDTFRVFLLRILNKRSPFSADRNHMHHYLIDLGLSHHKATFVLIGMNILAFLLVFFSDLTKVFSIHDFNAEILLIFIFAIYSIFSQVLSSKAVRK